MLFRILHKARERFVAETRAEQYWQRERMVYPENHTYVSALARHIEQLTIQKTEIKENLNFGARLKYHEIREDRLDPYCKARAYLSAFVESNAADEWSSYYSNQIQKSSIPVLDVLRQTLAGGETEYILDEVVEMVNESQRILNALFNEELDLYPDQYYTPCLVEFLYEWLRSSKQEAIEDFYMMFEFSLELFREECERMYKRYVRQILCILEMIELTVLSPEERVAIAEAL